MRNKVCVGSPSAHPRFSDSSGRLRTQDRVVLKAKTFYSESIYSRSSARERHGGQNPKKAKCMLSRVLSSWTTQDVLKSPSDKCHNSVKRCHQGSSRKTQHPKFSLVAGHVGTLCLARSKIPDSQKKSKR